MYSILRYHLSICLRFYSFFFISIYINIEPFIQCYFIGVNCSVSTIFLLFFQFIKLTQFLFKFFLYFLFCFTINTLLFISNRISISRLPTSIGTLSYTAFAIKSFCHFIFLLFSFSRWQNKSLFVLLFDYNYITQ